MLAFLKQHVGYTLFSLLASRFVTLSNDLSIDLSIYSYIYARTPFIIYVNLKMCICMCKYSVYMWRLYVRVCVYIYICAVGSISGPHLALCRVNKWSTFSFLAFCVCFYNYSSFCWENEIFEQKSSLKTKK